MMPAATKKLLLLALAFVACATAPKGTVDEFLALERRRSEAIRTKDFATLRDYYPPDFVGNASNGQRVTRDQLFALFERVDPATEASIDDLTVTPAGDLALVSARLTLRGKDGSTTRSRFLHAYRFRKGKWRMVTGLSAPIIVPPAADADKERWLTQLRESIRGRESEPAEKVFRNVRVLPETVPGVTAERLLRIMDLAYTRALGVSCTHCHVPERWDDDSKPAKTIARAMSRLTTDLNRDLSAIAELRDRQPAVTCTTCHRGQRKPATALP